MLKIAKFGGTSLADADRFLQVRDIVLSDPARRVVVVSAPGKRHPGDHKITDLLYLCHAHLQYGVSCWELFRRISARFLEIRTNCGLSVPMEQELNSIYESLSPATSGEYLASRGEYLSARLMAALLGYTFVDAASWLKFDYDGTVLRAQSDAALRQLAEGRSIVTPGFYGALPDGSIHTFSRGGSDITGALAAGALQADLYENWTDVDGVLAADPAIVPEPESIPRLNYRELQALSSVGMQVLHESAVEPVRQAQIPMQIRNTMHPEAPGTLISSEPADRSAAGGIVGFAVRQDLTYLCLPDVCLQPEVSEILRENGLSCIHTSSALGQLQMWLSSCSSDALHAALRQISVQPPTVQEHLSILAVLYRKADRLPLLLQSLQQSGVAVQDLALAPPCLLLLVRNEDCRAALRTAYSVRGLS